MLEPVFEEDESGTEECIKRLSGRHALAKYDERALLDGLYKRRSSKGEVGPNNSHPPVSYENSRRRHHLRLISRHNTRARRPSSASKSPEPTARQEVTPVTVSPASTSKSTTPVSSSPQARRLSSPPPPDPKRLSEEALLHALQNIRIEEEEELQLRRRSLRIINNPAAPPPEALPTIAIRRPSTASSSHPDTVPAPTAPDTESADDAHMPRAECESAEDRAVDDQDPYAGCDTYQLVRSEERLRDLEQQLQDTVCMMQDTVELVKQRLKKSVPGEPVSAEKTNEAQPAEDKARAARVDQVVESMKSQLARLGRAHDMVSTEHTLVAGEVRSRAPNGWLEEMARALAGTGRDGMARQ